jgi:hypothetical protein
VIFGLKINHLATLVGRKDLPTMRHPLMVKMNAAIVAAKGRKKCFFLNDWKATSSTPIHR